MQCLLLVKMLAFDIETEGLKAGVHAITIVCTQCYFTGEKRAYEFARLKQQGDMDAYNSRRNDLIEALDNAPTLCAFNGLAFDIPFIAKTFDVPLHQVAKWNSKLSDIFVYCKEKYRHTFSLNLLCETNQIPVKISSGLQAIKWAADGCFEDLKEYCEADVEILIKLYAKRWLCNPRNNAMMDLKLIAKQELYNENETKENLIAHPDTAPRIGAIKSACECIDAYMITLKPLEVDSTTSVPSRVQINHNPRNYSRMDLLSA